MPNMRAILNPGTGQITTQRKSSNRFNFYMDAPDYDLGQFRSQRFAKQFGLPTQGPSGESLESGDFGQYSANIKKMFGANMQSFMGMSPDQRLTSYNKIKGVGRDSATGASALFDPRTGMPTRPPENPQEAVQFQWHANEATRRSQEQMLKNSIGTLRYGLGQVNRGGPGGLAAMQNPLLGQMASTYHNTQYAQPDYSYFLRPDAFGGGMGQYQGGAGQAVPGMQSIAPPAPGTGAAKQYFANPGMGGY